MLLHFDRLAIVSVIHFSPFVHVKNVFLEYNALLAKPSLFPRFPLWDANMVAVKAGRAMIERV